MSCCGLLFDFNDLLVFLERISWIGCPAQVLGWVLTEPILSQKPKKPKKSKKLLKNLRFYSTLATMASHFNFFLGQKTKKIQKKWPKQLFFTVI